MAGSLSSAVTGAERISWFYLLFHDLLMRGSPTAREGVNGTERVTSGQGDPFLSRRINWA